MYLRPLLAIALLLVCAPARAADPKFEYREPEKVEGPEWSAQVKAGFILSTGNARSTSLAAGVSTSRMSRENRFSGEANVAYVRSTLMLAVDENGSGFIDPGEFQRVTQVTTQSWLVQGRYDRFFAESNSVFVSARASSDVPAGKELIGGGQLGYNRRLYKTDISETSIEAGYDFQYEKYESVEEAASIHSARLALKHATAFTKASLVRVDAEVLTNLNSESAPDPDGGNTVAPLKDYRINLGANLTSAITERISFGFTFKLRYDNVPAPRPPFSIPYAEGFLPFADKLDTVTEASLIITLL